MQFLSSLGVFQCDTFSPVSGQRGPTRPKELPWVMWGVPELRPQGIYFKDHIRGWVSVQVALWSFGGAGCHLWPWVPKVINKSVFFFIGSKGGKVQMLKAIAAIQEALNYANWNMFCKRPEDECKWVKWTSGQRAAASIKSVPSCPPFLKYCIVTKSARGHRGCKWLTGAKLSTHTRLAHDKCLSQSFYKVESSGRK